MFEELEAKQSIVIHLKWHTHFYINNWDAHFDNQTFRIFHNGRIECRDAFMLLSALCNGLKMSEYEAYWLTDFSLMISWACTKK